MFGGHLPGAISESPRRVNQDRPEMLRKVFEHRLASAVSCHALHRSASRLTFQWETSNHRRKFRTLPSVEAANREQHRFRTVPEIRYDEGRRPGESADPAAAPRDDR